MRKFFRDNGLSLVLGGCFVLLWIGQAVAGWRTLTEDERLHGGEPHTFGRYLRSGHFWQATAENWESEFLQMGAYIVLTSVLYQRGSAESRDPDAEGGAGEVPPREHGFFRRNGLSLAFGALFLGSFAMHAWGGLVESNDDRREHGLPGQTLGEFLGGAKFWFQSLQNWQSEFLAVLSVVVLTIFLRQHGSPESKRVDEPNSKTGK